METGFDPATICTQVNDVSSIAISLVNLLDALDINFKGDIMCSMLNICRYTLCRNLVQICYNKSFSDNTYYHTVYQYTPLLNKHNYMYLTHNFIEHPSCLNQTFTPQRTSTTAHKCTLQRIPLTATQLCEAWLTGFAPTFD